MTRLTARLSKVEVNIQRQRPAPTTFAVFWEDELTPCPEHARCYVEPETGRHHAGVIRLSFGAPDFPVMTGE